ncbi:MAG TPA: LysM domain-containing protein [Armatimonadota bacterium]|nr:LysM domain-containing protein [Armatimonadota bacterium]
MRNETPTHSRRRMWIERAVFAAILAGLGIWIAGSRLSGAPYTITVGGKPIATVESLRAAKAVLHGARLERASGVPADSVRFAQRVELRRAAKNAEFVDVPEAVGAVEKAAPVEVEAFAIVVDDRPAVALPKKEQAEQTLRLVKEHYRRNLGRLRIEPTFKEEVFVERRYVGVEKLCAAPEDAVRVLTSTAEKPVFHTVVAGDRAVNLAVQYGVPISEMKKLNQQMNLDELMEGDQLLVRKGKPPVTVVCKKWTTRTVAVTPPPEARRHVRAKTGKREMRILVTYENGELVSEDVISQVTTWETPEGRTHERSRP